MMNHVLLSRTTEIHITLEISSRKYFPAVLFTGVQEGPNNWWEQRLRFNENLVILFMSMNN